MYVVKLLRRSIYFSIIIVHMHVQYRNKNGNKENNRKLFSHLIMEKNRIYEHI